MRERILALGVSILCLLFASSAGAQEKVKVIVSHTTRGSLSIGSLLYGIERGFYRDEGIDLVYVSIRADLGIKALISGDVDYLYSVGTIIRGAALCIPVKTLSFDFAKVMHFLMSRPEINFRRSAQGKNSRRQLLRRYGRPGDQGCAPTVGVGSNERRYHRDFGGGHPPLRRIAIRHGPGHPHAHPTEYSNEERRL